MRKFATILALAGASIGAYAENVAISTPGTTLVLDVNKGAEPTFVYYGVKLSNIELSNLPKPSTANWSHLEVYPSYGATHTMSETAFAMRHADGNMSTQLLCEDFKTESISDLAPNGKERKGTKLTIKLKDPLYPDIVNLYYQAYDDVDMIECWTDVTNNGKQTEIGRAHV